MSLAALFWAAILLLAAAPKLADMPGSMLRAMRDLGLPSWLMRPRYAYAHVLIQLTLAAGLVAAPAPYSWIFTGGGAVLAAAYLVIVWLRRGFECRCLSDAPHTITSVTVLRNVFILGLALMSLTADGVRGLSVADWPALIPLLGAVSSEIAMRRA